MNLDVIVWLQFYQVMWNLISNILWDIRWITKSDSKGFTRWKSSTDMSSLHSMQHFIYYHVQYMSYLLYVIMISMIEQAWGKNSYIFLLKVLQEHSLDR